MRLDGIQIVDLTWLLPGAYGTQLLADMGARVIKIEPPGSGDYMRGIEYPVTRPIGREADRAEDSAEFEAVNRGKESVTLDLKSEAGREAFYRLVAESDAVIEAFRPGVAERLDIDYDRLTEYNEDIVYCSLTGYGQTGAYRDRPGHDHNYLAFAGFLDLNRHTEDERPTFPGYPICDMAGGVFAAFSLVSALLSRELGQRGGNYIDVAMTDVVLSFAQLLVPMARKTDPRPGETMITGKFPFLDTYRTADGEYLVLAAVEGKFWAEFCRHIDRPELIEHHFAEDPDVREEVRTEVQSALESKTRAEWEEIFDGTNVPVSPVQTLAEALDHPQTRSRDLMDDETKVGFPAVVRRGLDRTRDEAPEQGGDTEAVLRELGLSDAAVSTIVGDDPD
jgi:crotonobetainyl-CoA:carnitine CoA-transferase CaiB-like acyl-CoA transferase